MNKEELIQDPKRFEQFWDLMTVSFPKIERREREDVMSQLKLEHFALRAKFNQSSELEYIITYWELKEFIFIEHFALSHLKRGKGIGSFVLSTFIEKKKHPIVLEVEPPTNTMARRRIRFYERLGFTLFHWNYQQPPYREGDDFLDLFLMTNEPKLLENENGFQQIKAEIHRHVYASI